MIISILLRINSFWVSKYFLRIVYKINTKWLSTKKFEIRSEFVDLWICPQKINIRTPAKSNQKSHRISKHKQKKCIFKIVDNLGCSHQVWHKALNHKIIGQPTTRLLLVAPPDDCGWLADCLNQSGANRRDCYDDSSLVGSPHWLTNQKLIVRYSGP